MKLFVEFSHDGARNSLGNFSFFIPTFEKKRDKKLEEERQRAIEKKENMDLNTNEEIERAIAILFLDFSRSSPSATE